MKTLDKKPIIMTWFLLINNKLLTLFLVHIKLLSTDFFYDMLA